MMKHIVISHAVFHEMRRKAGIDMIGRPLAGIIPTRDLTITQIYCDSVGIRFEYSVSSPLPVPGDPHYTAEAFACYEWTITVHDQAWTNYRPGGGATDGSQGVRTITPCPPLNASRLFIAITPWNRDTPCYTMTLGIRDCHLPLIADQKQLEDDTREAFAAMAPAAPHLDPPQWIQSTITTQPVLGINVYCSHSSLPKTHIIRFFLPADPQADTVFWDNSLPPARRPEWGLAFFGEITTHQHSQQWHPDPDTGGVWIHGRDLLS